MYTKFVVVKCAEFSVLNTCIVCSPSLLRPTCHGMHSKLTAFEKFVQVLEFQALQFFLTIFSDHELEEDAKLAHTDMF